MQTIYLSETLVQQLFAYFIELTTHLFKRSLTVLCQDNGFGIIINSMKLKCLQSTSLKRNQEKVITFHYITDEYIPSPWL